MSTNFIKNLLIKKIIPLYITIISCSLAKNRESRKIYFLKKLENILPQDTITELNTYWPLLDSKNFNKISNFLGQLAHESSDFRYSEENLNYSLNKKLFLKLFSSRLSIVSQNINSGKYKIEDYIGPLNKHLLSTPVTDQDLINFIFEEQNMEIRKEKMLNIIYGMRPQDLGNNTYGDGWKYRGRGYLQITGKKNYSIIQKLLKKKLKNKTINLLQHPDLLLHNFKILSAILYFDSYKLWNLCSKPINQKNIKKITAKINTRLLGLQDRFQKTKKFQNLTNNLIQNHQVTPSPS